MVVRESLDRSSRQYFSESRKASTVDKFSKNNTNAFGDEPIHQEASSDKSETTLTVEEESKSSRINPEERQVKGKMTVVF